MPDVQSPQEQNVATPEHPPFVARAVSVTTSETVDQESGQWRPTDWRPGPYTKNFVPQANKVRGKAGLIIAIIVLVLFGVTMIVFAFI